jgi:signal transduction histidine kinase
MSEMDVIVIGDDTACAEAIRRVLAAQLPLARCEQLAPADMRVRPVAAALVIDGRQDGDAATDAVRRARAMGYAGGVIIVHQNGAAPDERLGARTVAFERLGHELLPRLQEAMTEAGSPFIELVMRARRLVAAGEVALTLQHSLNNPLAGLLAEVQMMQFEETTTEQREALDRMVALCRRMIEVTRSLDGIGERPLRTDQRPA